MSDESNIITDKKKQSSKKIVLLDHAKLIQFFYSMMGNISLITCSLLLIFERFCSLGSEYYNHWKMLIGCKAEKYQIQRRIKFVFLFSNWCTSIFTYLYVLSSHTSNISPFAKSKIINNTRADITGNVIFELISKPSVVLTLATTRNLYWLRMFLWLFQLNLRYEQKKGRTTSRVLFSGVSEVFLTMCILFF